MAAKNWRITLLIISGRTDFQLQITRIFASFYSKRVAHYGILIRFTTSCWKSICYCCTILCFFERKTVIKPWKSKIEEVDSDIIWDSSVLGLLLLTTKNSTSISNFDKDVFKVLLLVRFLLPFLFSTSAAATSHKRLRSFQTQILIDFWLAALFLTDFPTLRKLFPKRIILFYSCYALSFLLPNDRQYFFANDNKTSKLVSTTFSYVRMIRAATYYGKKGASHL